MIFGYTYEEAKKAVLAGALAAALLVAYVWHFGPGFQAAVLAGALAVLQVGVVFGSTNFNELDATKAVNAAITGLVTVVAYWTTVDANLVELVIALAAIAVQVYGVWKVRNAPVAVARR